MYSMIATPVSNRPNSSRINGSTQSQSTGEESSIHSQTSTHSSTNTPTSASSYPSHQNQNQNHHHHVDHHRSRNHVPIRIRSIPVSQSCSPSRRNQIHSNSNNVNNNNENNDKNKNIVLLSPRRERSKLVIESSSRNLSLSKSYDMKRSTSVPTPTSNSSMLNHVYNPSPSNSSSQHQHHYQYQNQHHQYQNQHQHLHSFFSHTTPKIVSIPHQNQTLPSPFIPKQHFQLPLPSPSSLPQNDKNDFETETDIITSKYSCMNSFPNIKLNLNCANSMRPRLENGDASSPDSGAGARSDKKHNSGGKGKGKFKGNGEHKSDPNHSNTHPNIYMDPNDDDKSSVFSLTTPGNRWKAMSQLAGPHKQDSKVFDISHRTDLTPESLKYGVPPAVASQVLDLRCNEISRMMNLYQDDNDNDNENDSDYDYDGNDDSGEDYNLNVRDNFLSAQHPTHLFSPSKDRIKQDRHVKSFGQKIGFYSADLPKFIDVVEHLFPNLLHITFDPSKVKEEKQQHQQHQQPSLDEHETKTESETESNEANIDPSNSDTSIQQQPQPQKNLTNVQSNSKTNTTNTTSSPLFHNNLFPSLTSQNLEIAKREVNRMKRLYIIFRLPKLLSIDFEPITEEERQMARPAGPNGCKVKKEQWLTKALKDWDINDAMSKSNTHSHYMSPIHSPRHQHHNQRSETIESWESMSTGGIECTFPEKLPSLSNDDRDKMVKESLDQEKRHISEQDDGSQNPKSHVKSKRMFLSPKRKKSSPKVKKNDKHEKSNKMDTVEEEQDTDTILNDWNDAIKSPSSSLATAMNLRKSFPLSSEENSSQNNTLFIDVPTGRTYTKPSTSATASKEVLDPNFNSSAMTHTNANTNGTKPRFTNRRPPTSPASTLRPIPVTKTKGKAWSRRRWRKSSDSNKGGAGGVGGRPLASSASIADEEDGSSEEEEDDDNNDELVYE